MSLFHLLFLKYHIKQSWCPSASKFKTEFRNIFQRYQLDLWQVSVVEWVGEAWNIVASLLFEYIWPNNKISLSFCKYAFIMLFYIIFHKQNGKEPQFWLNILIKMKLLFQPNVKVILHFSIFSVKFKKEITIGSSYLTKNVIVSPLICEKRHKTIIGPKYQQIQNRSS